MDDRTYWNERYRAGEGPTRLNPRLEQFLPLLKPGRALDLAGGMGQNSKLLSDWRVVLLDISEEALARASNCCARVQAAAPAVPFPNETFDTIVDTYFLEPRLDLASLLTPGGTLFLETYTLADQRYRPSFDPTHRLDPARIKSQFEGLEILHFKETDDGNRVFGTLVARKPEI